MSKVVEKKILPVYFTEVADGTKTFELRKDEDDIQVGDVLILREWNGYYTGRVLKVSVTYVLRDCPRYGLKEGFAIYGLDKAINIYNGGAT